MPECRTAPLTFRYMPPSLALILWLVLLVTLFCFDPAKDRGTSPALWVPLIWMFFLGTRLPSQWLGGPMGTVEQALEDGDPLNRSISFGLILLAIGILASRSFKWGSFFARNAALSAFLLFALVSVLWSDYSFVAFKRWFRDLGNYAVILVALSDPRPLEAVRTLLRRLCYLIIPLSVLIIKYYLNIGRVYETWTGNAQIVGPTTSKNMLGVACLISGLFFFWDTMARWSDRKQQRTRRILLVNIAFIGMTLWVMNMAKSTTSNVCLVLGCLVIAAAHSKLFQRHPNFLKVLVPASFCLYLILSLGLGMSGSMAAAVGKDATLTDRTKIWATLFRMDTDPLLGAGYESFWMGPRLHSFWRTSGLQGINEAHNGYLEVYINLGLIGLVLFSIFLISSYLSIWRSLKPFSGLASLALALWTIMLFYSVSEAGFRSGLMWVTFLLGAIAVPGRALARVPTLSAFENTGAHQHIPGYSFETKGHWS
jgi:O-antigen ligase